MYNVYITYFKNSDGTINSSSSESLMFTIPRPSNDFPISTPRVKTSEDSADSFDFSIEKNSPYFDSLIRLKTRLRVEYDGDTIFYGRVLTIGEGSFLKTKNVHCEGVFSFCNDTYYEAVSSKNGKKITWSEYYNKIFQNHNNQISASDPWKVINRGTVDFTPINESRKFEPSSWTQTIGLFNNLTDTFGGHMRTRYYNGSNYIDWYKYYWRDRGANRPFVEIGRNIMDISSDNKVDNVSTRIIPIGDTDHNGNPIYIDGYVYTDKNGQQHTHQTKYIPLTLLCDLFTEQQLNDEFHSYSDYEQSENDHSVIYKTQNFSDANTKEKLWNYAIDWIKKSYFGIANSFTVKAVDMHVVNNEYPKILCGECVDVKCFRIQNGVKIWDIRKLVCKSAQYDLFKPENNMYVFGIPADLLSHNYTEQKKKQDISASAGKKPLPGEEEEAPITFRSVAEMIGTKYTGVSPYVLPYYGTDARNSMLENGMLSATVKLYDPEETLNPITEPDKSFDAQLLGRISLSGYDDIYVAVCDKGVCAFRTTQHSWGYLPAPVDLWYIKKNGTKYNPLNSIVTEAIPNTGTVAGIGIMLGDSSVIKATAQGLVAIGSGDGIGALLANGLTGILPKVTVDGGTGDTLIEGSNAGIRVKDSVANKVSVAINGAASTLTLRNTVADTIAAIIDGNASKLDLRNVGLNKDSIELDGLGEKVLIGINGSAFRVKINEPASYTDENGDSHSNVRGFVIADDLKLLDDDTLRSVDSFKSDRVVTKQLIADRATIAQLNALQANINSLLANYARITYVEANYVKADSIDSNRILISKSLAIGSTGSMVNLYNGTVQANTIQVNSGGSLRLVGSGSGEYYDLNATNIQNFIKSASVDPLTNTLTLTPVHGEPINFSKASTTVVLTGSWGTTSGRRNVYTVKANGSDTNTHQIAVRTLFSAGEGMYSVGTYQTNLQQGPVAVQETFTSYKLALNGSDIEIQNASTDEKISNTPSYSILSDLAAAEVTGWSNAYAKVVLPSANTSRTFITVKTPASTSIGGTDGQNTNTYYLSADDTHAYIRAGSSTGTIVAQSSIAGWTAAYNQVELPGEGTGSSITIKTPADSSSASSVQVSTTYELSNYDNNSVQLKTGTTIVAKFSHNKYNEGRNAVTITKGSWSGGQVTFTKSAGTASTKGVKVGLTGSWGTGNDANKYTYIINDYYDNEQGVSTGYTSYIDATTRYNAGVTAGTTAGQNAVTINKGSWSNAQVTFTKSVGTASTKGVKIGLSGSWGTGDNVNKYSYTLKDYYDNEQGINIGYSGTIDATARYNAGVTAGTTAGQNAVTINKGSWSNAQVTFTKSAGTASTKGVKIGLSGSWGTGDNVNKYSYTLKDYYDNEQGVNIGYSGTVDATARYNAGVTAGQNGVTITKGSWSSGQVTFTKSAGTASTKGVKVGLDGSWGTGDNVNKYSYTIKDYYDNTQGVTTGYTGTIDASARYNAGVTAGKNAVTLNDPTWNSVSGTTPTFRTLTVTTNGRPTQLSKTKTIYLTVGTWSNGYIPIYVRDGSTSGTAIALNSVSAPAATLSAGTWSNGKVTVTAKNGTYSMGTLEVSAPSVTVSAGSWASGSVTVTAKHGTQSLGSTTVSVPSVTATSWVNTTGRTWRADVTIGGVTRSSGTKDFGGYYTDGVNSVTIPTANITFSGNPDGHSATIYIKATNNQTNYVNIDYFSAVTWDGNVATGNIAIQKSGGNWVNSGAHFVVDATDRYNAGKSDGAASVTIPTANISWSGNPDGHSATVYMEASNGQTNYVYIDYFSAVTWNGNTATGNIAIQKSGGNWVNSGAHFVVDATDRYNAGKADGAASVGVSSLSSNYVANTNNLPSGTKHYYDTMTSRLASYRNSQGYIYLRFLVGSTYHVVYWPDNGNGWQ